MSRVLLADDSPHAQRMGERLLRDGGHEVFTVADGKAVVAQLADVDPEILILDAGLPLKSGYEIARLVRSSDLYKHAAVVLTGSLAEPVDEAAAKESGADAVLPKPFEAAALERTLEPLLERVQLSRASRMAAPPPPFPGREPLLKGPLAPEPEPEFAPLEDTEPAVDPAMAVTEEERVRAAVTLALDAAMPRLIEELTRQTVRALHSSK
jgi:DNA-binding response OmpR family regulator